MRFKKHQYYYLDTKTDLEWSVESYGPMSWQEAMDFCSGLGPGWRLPTIEELFSLIDYTKFDPATKLRSMHSSYYWSGSTYADGPDGAWGVDFADGGVSYDYKTNHYYVRCVRGGSV